MNNNIYNKKSLKTIMTKNQKKRNKEIDSSKENSILENENIFEKELEKLPPEIKKKLNDKKDKIDEFVKIIEKKSNNKSMGFYINPKIITQPNDMRIPDFSKITINFLLDDFETNIPEFNPKILLGKDFEKYLIEETIKDNEGNQEIIFKLKSDKNIIFEGNSISLLRENCFDSNYEDLEKLGTSIIYKDPRGFISALKTIDIHRNMLLQKFEKYVVAYVGAGSWLRGEKSNDFDVFIVIDDTDVKRMPRMQVKDQLTKIIWQLSHEVASLTGIQIHIQVYLLTDFWDALKDAHPVMFTFLRDGVPFYDRGIYNAWKELLKLGKIRPSAEAIDMHMNLGTQLIDRAKGIFNEIVINDVYNAVLSPSQAILMLKGYNPTTPKETVKMFKDVLLAKEKSITEKDVEILDNTVKTFKKIEHDKEFKLTGKDVDKMLADADKYLAKIKKMFEEITEERTKESIITSYSELLTQIRSLPEFHDENEKTIFKKFEKEYIDSGKLPAFTKKSLKSLIKAKSDFDKGKITVTEVNKVLKEVRNILTEIKTYRDKNYLSELNNRRLILNYDNNKNFELINFENKVYLIKNDSNEIFELDKDNNFKKTKINLEILNDNSKINNLNLNSNLIKACEKLLKTDKILF